MSPIQPSLEGLSEGVMACIIAQLHFRDICSLRELLLLDLVVPQWDKHIN
jgi:hypothetical protein